MNDQCFIISAQSFPICVQFSRKTNELPDSVVRYTCAYYAQNSVSRLLPNIHLVMNTVIPFIIQFIRPIRLVVSRESTFEPQKEH